VSRPDTSDKASLVVVQVLQKMTGGQRVDLAVEMSEESREIARCGIRSRHPAYTPSEIEHALHRLLLGDDLADRAWPQFVHLRP
jgi:hypothetical protein